MNIANDELHLGLLDSAALCSHSLAYLYLVLSWRAESSVQCSVEEERRQVTRRMVEKGGVDLRKLGAAQNANRET